MADSDRPDPHARAPWRTRSTRPVYENNWIKLREDVALMPDGRTTIYGVVEAGESLEQAAQRELAEEAGREAGSLIKLCDFHTSKSIMSETAHFLAKGA